MTEEEISECEAGSVEIIQIEEQRPVGQYQVYQYPCNGTFTRRGDEKGTEIFFEKITTKILQNLIKNINLHIQETQQSPSRETFCMKLSCDFKLSWAPYCSAFVYFSSSILFFSVCFNFPCES